MYNAHCIGSIFLHHCVCMCCACWAGLPFVGGPVSWGYGYSWMEDILRQSGRHSPKHLGHWNMPCNRLLHSSHFGDYTVSHQLPWLCCRLYYTSAHCGRPLSKKYCMHVYVISGAYEPPVGRRRSVRPSIRSSLLALLYLMEWAAVGYFPLSKHWPLSIVIASFILHSLQTHC